MRISSFGWARPVRVGTGATVPRRHPMPAPGRSPPPARPVTAPTASVSAARRCWRLNRTHFIKQMKDFKSGARRHGHASPCAAYDDAEIEKLADYFASQKRR